MLLKRLMNWLMNQEIGEIDGSAFDKLGLDMASMLLSGLLFLLVFRPFLGSKDFNKF